MAENFRHADILALARRSGKVTVEALAAHFDVTLQTIRRDLTDLAETGQLTRVHGGAVLPSGVSNIAHGEREMLNAAAKSAIARTAAAQIPNDCTLMLNIGTTTEAVARALAQHRNLTVITNNINIAHILAPHDSAEVILTGGSLRRADGGLVGDLALAAIEQFRPDIAVIGASSIDASGDLLDYDLSETRISRTIIARARQTILVADPSKYTRTAPVRIASLADVDKVISTEFPDAIRQKSTSWHTELIVAA